MYLIDNERLGVEARIK